MQKIINGADVKRLDELYVKAIGITSFDLMERAAETFCAWYVDRFDRGSSLAIFCGTGNNGGDGLAIGRILSSQGYKVSVFYRGELGDSSKDFLLNYDILPASLNIQKLDEGNFPFANFEIIIDAVFGVGTNRPLSGGYLDLISSINRSKGVKISIDLPSGLPADKMLEGEAFRADYTVSFQFPKLSLFFPEHALYVGELTILDIGIDDSYFDTFDCRIYFTRQKDLPARHRKFHRFSHKGDFGKVMLIGGSYGKIGAVRMSSEAALKTGSGLVSCFLPGCGVDILQIALPEVMVERSEGKYELRKEGLNNLDRFDALGVGPGMGNSRRAQECLEFILGNFSGPIVLDADALNILSTNTNLLALLRENMVLTPHIVEFDRLVGKCANHMVRMARARDFCATYGCFLVLKGANTLITTPDGRQFFNSTGNQFMATAGAGDVLTGILTSFLGQGYSPENASICGVYHHGLAGEMASTRRWRGTTATDIIDKIPATFERVDGGLDAH